MLVLPVLSCSLLLPPHGWTAPARRPLWAVCQAPTPDVSDGGGEQGDPRGPKPADHRRVKSASQASEAVGQHGQSAPSAAPWLGAPPSAGQPVSPSLGVRPPPRVLERSRRPFTASLAMQVDHISHLHLPLPPLHLSDQVDSSSSSQSFFEGPGSMAGQVEKRWTRSSKKRATRPEVRARVRVRVS